MFDRKFGLYVVFRQRKDLFALLPYYPILYFYFLPLTATLTLKSTSGCPVGTVPLSYADFDGRAFDMHIIASPGCQSIIFEVMSAWESTFPEVRQNSSL